MTIVFLLSGCASSTIADLDRKKTYNTYLVGLYYDDSNFYVRYKADTPWFSTYDKVGKISKDALWNCAKKPEEESKIPDTVKHNNISYGIYLLDPRLATTSGKSCGSYEAIIKTKDIDLNSLKHLPFIKTKAINKDDPIFNDNTQSFYAFNVKPDDKKYGRYYILHVDRAAKKVLVMQGVNMPESYITYRSKTNSKIKTIGTAPAVIFDIVTLPAQVGFVLFTNKNLGGSLNIAH